MLFIINYTTLVRRLVARTCGELFVITNYLHVVAMAPARCARCGLGTGFAQLSGRLDKSVLNAAGGGGVGSLRHYRIPTQKGQVNIEITKQNTNNARN